MATGTLPLDIGAALFPDGTASNIPPAVQRVKSSAGAPTPYFLQLAFDAATDEICFWSGRMPDDYASAPVLKAQFKMASATTGNVIVTGSLMAVTPGDSQDVDADAFATVNTSSATAVPGTAGFLAEITLALTNADSLAAGDFYVFRFSRDADNAGDTAAGDLELTAAAITYTTT